jgi:vacuolar-type H+-ATPase subunit F/Vma7
VALVAIAAIGYAIYQRRGEIKEGVLDSRKAVKSFVKDLIDKLPTFQARENNFAKLNSNLLEQYRKSTGEEQTELNNKIEIIKMLQDKDQRSAIEKLVEEEEIKGFSREDMKRLIEKGLSTHEIDKKALEELVDKFQPAIMFIGEDSVEKVKEKVNEKVKKTKPPYAINSPSSKKVEDPEKGIKK